jgi:hypothetical protein
MLQDIVRPRRSALEVDDADANWRKLKDWVKPAGAGGPSGGSGYVLTIEVGALADVTGHPPSIPKDLDLHPRPKRSIVELKNWGESPNAPYDSVRTPRQRASAQVVWKDRAHESFGEASRGSWT